MEELKKDLHGCKLELYWPESAEWFAAEVTSHSKDAGCVVLYDNGEEETLSTDDLAELVCCHGVAWQGKRPKLRALGAERAAGKRSNRGLAKLARQTLEELVQRHTSVDHSKGHFKKSKLIMFLPIKAREDVAQMAGLTLSELMEIIDAEESKDSKSDEGKRQKSRPKAYAWTQKCESVLQRMRSTKAADGRIVGEDLYRLPTQQQAPEYHEKIRNPIDIETMEHALNRPRGRHVDMCID